MSETNEFVERFDEAWKDPVRRFADLFAPDGTLYQQGMERPIKREEITAHVTRVLSLLPGQRIEVLRSAANGDEVFIEWRATATFLGEPISWTGASRFTLENGLIAEEVAYFDTLPLRALVDPSLRRGDMTAAAVAAVVEGG